MCKWTHAENWADSCWVKDNLSERRKKGENIKSRDGNVECKADSMDSAMDSLD